MATMMPPPVNRDAAARRQAASVAVKNRAFPSTIYLVLVRESSLVDLSAYLHDRESTMRSVIVVPMQWP